MADRASKYILNDPNDPKKGYHCATCGETILATTVARPVWDGPFPCSGSGRCEYETFPYCPKCDVKPNFHGAPYSPKGSYHNP